MNENEIAPSTTPPSPSPPPLPASDASARKKWWIENLVSLLVALVLVFMVRSSLIEAFKIPSGSMIPTLWVGDHIFVNKLAYGFQVPFSEQLSAGPIYLFKREAPQRGQIIVFKYPKDESLYFIKRIIGVAGDQIEVKDKVIYLNSRPLNRRIMTESDTRKILTSLNDSKYSSESIEIYFEESESGEHAILIDPYSFMGENFGPIQVPPDHLFVMGDNRDYSNDSRLWGFVPVKNVRGRAFVIWLSIWPNWSDGTLTWNPDRIGTLLQ